MGEKVRAQAEAQYGDILKIDELTQLVYLLGREKLRHIGDYDIVPACFGVFLDDILLGRDYLCAAGKSDAAFYDIRAVWCRCWA